MPGTTLVGIGVGVLDAGYTLILLRLRYQDAPALKGGECVIGYIFHRRVLRQSLTVSARVAMRD